MGKISARASLRKLTFAGVIVTLGIAYGDIGTSPLYVMKAITSAAQGDKILMIYGALSCIFWTLTLQTTIKYMVITLRADNHGEGGIFALFALLKKKNTLAAILTMIGGCTLLADGIITPSITVTSSIEGLQLDQSGNPGCSGGADNPFRFVFCATVRDQCDWPFIRSHDGGVVYHAWRTGNSTINSDIRQFLQPSVRSMPFGFFQPFLRDT